MPFIFRNSELEEKLNQHAKRQAVPTTKGRLVTAIVRAALEAADNAGTDAGQIIRQLSTKTKTGAKDVAA